MGIILSIRTQQKLLKRRKGVDESRESRKSFILTVKWNLANLVKIYHGNHCASTPHRSETNGIAERAVRRVKEGTSAVLLQSGLNESWWADSMECYTSLRNVTAFFLFGRRPMKRFGQKILRTDYSFWFIG